MTDRAVLYKFPPSDSCETAEWLLKLYDIPVDVRTHGLPFLGFFIILKDGNNVPVVTYRGQDYNRILVIADALEKLVPEQYKLFPTDAGRYREAKELWEGYIGVKLDYAVSLWAYYQLLPFKDVVMPAITKGIPGWQKWFTRIAYPYVAHLIRKSQAITDENYPKATRCIRDTWDKVDSLLADGRPYILGDDLSMLDIGFAGMAAPCTLEPRYGGGGLLPAIEDIPEDMAVQVREFQERPAGRHIATIYKYFR